MTNLSAGMNWHSKKEMEANAMTISTVDESKRPSSRIVLLKSFDLRGFVFYTNIESRKVTANSRTRLLRFVSIGNQ